MLEEWWCGNNSSSRSEILCTEQNSRALDKMGIIPKIFRQKAYLLF